MSTLSQNTITHPLASKKPGEHDDIDSTQNSFKDEIGNILIGDKKSTTILLQQLSEITADKSALFKVIQSLSKINNQDISAHFFNVLAKKIKQIPIKEYTIQDIICILQNIVHFDTPPLTQNFLKSVRYIIESKNIDYKNLKEILNIFGEKIPKLIFESLVNQLDKNRSRSTKFKFLQTELPDEILNTFLEKINIYSSEYDSKTITKIFNSITGFEDTNISKKVLQLLSEKVTHQIEQYSKPQITTILYSLKNFTEKMIPEELVESCIHTIEKNISQYTFSQLSCIMCGLRNYNHPLTEQLFEIITPQIVNNKLSSNLALYGDLLSGMNYVSFQKREKIRIHLWENIYKHRKKYYQPIPLEIMTKFARGCARIGVNMPNFLHKIYTEKVKKYSIAPNIQEKKVIGILKTILPNNQIQIGTFKFGFECDIYIPSLRLNIEIDGKQHIAQRLKDSNRDSCLKKYRITVLRINDVSPEKIQHITDQINNLLKITKPSSKN